MPDRPFAEVAMTLRVLDLFSGIGAFSLGLERAGMRTVAFCECDPYCRRVLKRHWPEVPCYDDIRTLTAARLARDGLLATDASDTENDGRTGGTWCGATGQWLVSSVKASGGGQADRAGEPCRRGIDVICGGFPCQDISVAGRGDGIDGERSGLWSEYARLIGELRPRYAIVENVAALVVRGLERVVGDLAALGYDAEWRIISAADMGAPHLRERIWIVAYPSGDGCDAGREGASGHVWHAQPSVGALREPGIWAAGGTDDVADADGDDTERRRTATHAGNGGESDAARLRQPARGSGADDVAHTSRAGLSPSQCAAVFGTGWRDEGGAVAEWWGVEPDVGRVAHGVASRVDRLRALGNSLVPQIPEAIGRAILAAENA